MPVLTVYEKNKWVKVTFNQETKRIRDPPLNYGELVDKLLARFPVLRILVEHQQRPQDIDLFWRNSLIENSFDLQSVIRTCKKENKVVHLLATTHDRPVHE